MKQSVAGTTRRSLRAFVFPILISSCIAGGCVRRHYDRLALDHTRQPTTSPTPKSDLAATTRININTASSDELEKLPGIGKALAGRIIEHREKFGPFRKPEHLIIVRGISDKRFRALQDLITVE